MHKNENNNYYEGGCIKNGTIREFVVPPVLDKHNSYNNRPIMNNLMSCLYSIQKSFSNKEQSSWAEKHDGTIISSLVITEPIICSSLFVLIKTLGSEVHKDIKVLCRKERVDLEIPVTYFRKKNNVSVNSVEEKIKSVLEKPTGPKISGIIREIEKKVIVGIPNLEYRKLLMRVLGPMMKYAKDMFINARYESSGFNNKVSYTISLQCDTINCNLIDYICKKQSDIIHSMEVDTKAMRLKILMKKTMFTKRGSISSSTNLFKCEKIQRIIKKNV